MIMRHHTLCFMISAIGMASPFLSFAQDVAPLKNSKEVNDECWQRVNDPDAALACKRDAAADRQAKLDALYAKRMEEAKHFDEDVKRLTPMPPYMEQALTKSQQDFSAYMESECTRQKGSAMGGEVGNALEAGCRINLLNQRLEILGYGRE